MELMLLIGLVLFLVFGVPVILIIAGIVRMRSNRDLGKRLLIFGVAWLIIGGGICASLLMS